MRIITGLLLLSAVAWAGERPRDLPAHPNILFIAVDDLRPELGAYGVSYVKSPNIDRLANQGVIFRQAHVQSAVCNPSRASLLTGLRPDTTKVWDLSTDLRQVSPDVVTLPQYLKARGYHTVAVGKIFHNIFPDALSWSEPQIRIPGYPFDPDAVYRAPENMAIQEAKKQEFIKAGKQAERIDQYGEWYLKAKATEAADLPDNAYFDGAQTDAALAKLAELKGSGQPFFFGVGFYRPHLPFNAPKKYWDLYDRAAIPLAADPFVGKDAPVIAINNLRELKGYTDFAQVKHPAEGSLTEAEARLLKHGYLASVSYVDAQVGRLLQRLEELGLAENTIVVLWGDNGWKLGEHNSWAKMTNYDVDTRVPLIVRMPGHSIHPAQVDRMVELVDLFPSLCELSGVPVPEHLEGRSFVPLMTHPAQPWKPAVFSQYLADGIWAPPDGKAYMGYTMRTDRYRYTAWLDWKTKAQVAVELYDHKADPLEDVNIAERPEMAEIKTELAHELAAGWRAQLPK
jgi:arylsulfatase A-like enzyme